MTIPMNPRQWSFRTQLTLSFVAVALVSGLSVIGLSYAVLRIFPYRLDVTFSDTDWIKAEVPVDASVLNRMLAVSLVVLVVVTALSALAGWIIAGRSAAPLRRLRDVAGDIAGGNLSRRLEVGEVNEEITDLAHSFNHMCDSVTHTIAAHKRFSAAASHELLTPIATMITMIDVEAMDEKDPQRQQFLQSLREISQANNGTVKALLDLADAESYQAQRVPTQLDEMINAALSEFETELFAHKLRLDTQLGGETILVDPALAHQVIRNLLANAIRHNENGGFIEVESSGSQLRITNSGPVVSDTQLIEEPFYRAAGRVKTSESGHGLGLSIVRAAAEAIDATLTFDPRAGGGLEATVRF